MTNARLQFSHVWHGANMGLHFPALWDSLRQFTGNPRKILEIGSFEGCSTCAMIELFAAHNPIAVTCIDTWEGAILYNQQVEASHEELFHRNVQFAVEDAPNAVSVRTIKSDSHLALSSLIHGGESETFDWIYIDGSHEAPDVLSDAVASFKLLKSGGVMVFDDYLWDDAVFQGGHINNTPKPAIDAFINIHHDRIRVLPGGPLYQLYAVKR